MVDHIAGRGRQDLYLRVGGLVSDTNEYVTWRSLRLRRGDEIALKIIETDVVDRPRKRVRADPKDQRKSKAFVRAIGKKLGGKLVTTPRGSK